MRARCVWPLRTAATCGSRSSRERSAPPPRVEVRAWGVAPSTGGSPPGAGGGGSRRAPQPRRLPRMDDALGPEAPPDEVERHEPDPRRDVDGVVEIAA